MGQKEPYRKTRERRFDPPRGSIPLDGEESISRPVSSFSIVRRNAVVAEICVDDERVNTRRKREAIGGLYSDCPHVVVTFGQNDHEATRPSEISGLDDLPQCARDSLRRRLRDTTTYG